MKKPVLFIALCLSLILSTACSNSTSDEFEEANGDVKEKLLKSVTVNSNGDYNESRTITLTYNNQGALSTISNGEESSVLIYENNSLTNITGGGESASIEDISDSPYDAFETGIPLEYDNNGNPTLIEFIEESYDYETDSYYNKVYTAEVSYDKAPNPYYYTLESAGIISAMDKIKLNFSLTSSPELVKAKSLFPVNNPSQIIYKNNEGDLLLTLTANYDYDDEQYPETATITAVSTEYNETSIVTAIYSYLK
ncbi:hypothetical protein [Formosa sp. S-31]|uniref:hypothetical protein n=1 Tax=Formosa sp. S-31 TaxID=2790949 RepID=UPI003EBF5A3A